MSDKVASTHGTPPTRPNARPIRGAALGNRRAFLGGMLGGVGGIVVWNWSHVFGRAWADPTDVDKELALPARFAVEHSDAEWRSMLSKAAYTVLRQQGTERPYSSPLDAQFAAGTYLCTGCAQPVFDGATKFHSGTGWPSFWAPRTGAVDTTTDLAFGMRRTEVHCHSCGGHLGHVFQDGPRPTGLRYCINGCALTFDRQQLG